MVAMGIQEMVNVCNRTMSRLDSVTNNIANIQTSGYKAEHLYYVNKGSASAGAQEPQFDPVLVVDYSQGALQVTGNPLDLAIEGDGFFVIQTKDGESYTRKGNFTINKQNEIVTQAGDYLLGESGKISLNGQDVTLSSTGEVLVDGNRAGKLRIVTFDSPQALVRNGGGLFSDPGGAGVKPLGTPDIKSGHLEISNVKVIKDMVEMINIQRSVELYQKSIQTISDQDKVATSRVGKLV